MKSSTFTNNTASVGGAIRNYGTAMVNFSRIIGNHAYWDGSAVFNSDASINATNNWWGSNKPDFSSLLYGDDINYSTWMMLRISANHRNIAYLKSSKITADLTWNTKDGFKPNIQPSRGYIPDGTPVVFGILTGKGNINPKGSVTTKGKSYSIYTGTARGTAKIYAKIDNQTQTTNITVSFKVPEVTIPQLNTAARTIQTYYESHHNKLPSSVKVAGQTLTMPQLLKLLVTATLNINKHSLKPINVTRVGKPTSPGGNYATGKLYKYLSVAQNIKTFIDKNGRAPNYAQTTLGKIPYSKLVYMYSKVINFYGQKNRLPHYVSTKTNIRNLQYTYETSIVNLTDKSTVQGGKVKVWATLEAYNHEEWDPLGWRYLNFYLYNAYGKQMWSDRVLTDLPTGTATTSINTKKLNLTVGTYLIKVTYGGNSKWGGV